MTTTDLADVLIVLMPYALAFNTLVFLLLWLMLTVQGGTSRLEFWINALFLSIFVKSGVFTYLIVFLTATTNPADIDTLPEWGLTVALNALPILTAFAGLKVAQWTNREVRGEAKNARDVRQDAQQLLLDAASVLQTETGKVLAQSELIAAQRNQNLSNRAASMDVREADVQEREVAANEDRSALDETIIHTGEDVTEVKADVAHIRDRMDGERP